MEWVNAVPDKTGQAQVRLVNVFNVFETLVVIALTNNGYTAYALPKELPYDVVQMVGREYATKEDVIHFGQKLTHADVKWMFPLLDLEPYDG